MRASKVAVNDLLGDTSNTDIKKDADAETAQKHCLFSRIQLWPLWVGLHVAVIVLGVLMTVLSKPPCT